jgi:fermentation-respiration switch protein FrsA (DUF1100 family)
VAGRSLGLGLLFAVTAAACGTHRAPLVHPPGVSLDRQIPLSDQRLTLHAADRRVREHVPLLIYATGDRGWAGKDLDVFRQLVSWGYPVAGFDAHDYVKHLKGVTTPVRVARDYGSIIAVARDALHLDRDVPVVLVGVSRGAGLSVVAAGQRLLRGELQGLVVMGLTREEEYVTWRHRFGRRSAQPPNMVEVYEYLPRLGSLPLTIIQSTRDNYLPAASARKLFGADTDRHHLIAVDAKNHSFAGARPELYAALQQALASVAATR